VNFPYLSNHDIDTEAERLRLEALGTRAQVVPVDLEIVVYDYLCEAEQLSIDDDAYLPDEEGDEVLGKTLVRAGRILINRRLKTAGDLGRYRFTLAHELGHWRLHRPQVLAAADQRALFPEMAEADVITTLNRSIVGPNPPRHEIQANRFGATLLINPQALQREFAARFGAAAATPVLAHASDLTLRERGRLLAGHAVGVSPSLASAFAVSIEAMAIALEARGYLADGPTLFTS